jgi:hypothetical protein
MKPKTTAPRFALRLTRKTRFMGGVWRACFNHLFLVAMGICGPADAFASNFPSVQHWMRAGVEGGIPTSLPIVARVTPDDDLQAAIDTAPATGGIIALTAGRYRLTTTLRLRSGIVLRGTGPKTTLLDLGLRNSQPADLRIATPSEWVAGVRLEGIDRAGLMNLAITFDSTVPRPPDLRAMPNPWVDNPGGQADLHVVSILFQQTRNCWLVNCVIENSGSHPLVIADSQHVTLEFLEIAGTHNRGPGSGSLALIGSEYVLASEVRTRAINGVVLQSQTDSAACRANLFLHARFETDLRLHGSGTTDNLLENCVIRVPAWLNHPPLSPGNAAARQAPPGPGNLLHLCTITREFPAAARVFSMADDPTQIYQVIQTHVRDGATSVEIFGPAPAAASLLPPR